MINKLIIDKSYRNLIHKRDVDEFNNFFQFKHPKKSKPIGITTVPGFRPKSRHDIESSEIRQCAFCVLVTTYGEVEWPDSLDPEAGIFTYYGDNKSPGNLINETTVGGNLYLEFIFEHLHNNNRKKIQPLLCFESYKPKSGGSYMRFLGLAAPGATDLSTDEDLVGVWKISDGKRFQNYKSILTILDEQFVEQAWLEDMVNGIYSFESQYCPKSWKKWIDTGIYQPLQAKNEFVVRSKEIQLPTNEEEKNILKILLTEFNDRDFEFAAKDIIQFLNSNFRNLSVTPKIKDGGMDVIGKYYIGHDQHQIILDLIAEAKFYNSNNKVSVGVSDMKRLISRLKETDIGVFITSSYFGTQVQGELNRDRRPILLISGGDIARILIKNGLSNNLNLKNWINSIKSKNVT
jgi:hypothetical protein